MQNNRVESLTKGKSHLVRVFITSSFVHFAFFVTFSLSYPDIGYKVIDVSRRDTLVLITKLLVVIRVNFDKTTVVGNIKQSLPISISLSNT